MIPIELPPDFLNRMDLSDFSVPQVLGLILLEADRPPMRVR